MIPTKVSWSMLPILHAHVIPFPSNIALPIHSMKVSFTQNKYHACMSTIQVEVSSFSPVFLPCKFVFKGNV